MQHVAADELVDGSSWDGETPSGDHAGLDAPNMGGEGVTVSANRKLWQPGQSGNPLGRGKADLAMLKELRKEYPPVVIINMLNESYELARTNRAPKAMLGVVELILAYQLGKPKVSITHEKGLGATYLETLASLPPGAIVSSVASNITEDEQ
jgi:hypothetical protein